MSKEKYVDESKVSLCRSCDAEIVWMKTRNDKNIPVDVPPMDDPKRDEILLADLFDRATMKTHFETCPNAKEHRQARTPAAASADPGVNAKRLNIAVAVLEDIVKNGPDGLRSQELAKTALKQIREVK